MLTEQRPEIAPTFGGTTVAVTGLYHYPIKSCAGTALTEATLDARGIRHDRELMVVDAASGTFLTQRELPRMALIAPQLDDHELRVSAPGVAPLAVPVLKEGATSTVRVWRDTVPAVDQGDAIAAWLGHFLGRDCRLVRLAEGFVRRLDPTYASGPDNQVGLADGFPVLLIAQESLEELNRRLEAPLPMNRFRPNVVIAGGVPHGEDRVARLRIGNVVFNATKACARCTITLVDQATGQPGKEPLRTFASYRRAERGVLFGQNLIHAAPGTVRIGDPVEALLMKDEEPLRS